MATADVNQLRCYRKRDEQKPLTEFRKRRRNGSASMHECRNCHNASLRLWREKRRSKKQHREMTAYLAEINRAQTRR